MESTVPACILGCHFPENGKNIFDDPSGELGLSKEAYYFIGGIMKHMKGMSAITNPLVNSYKRLVPGYEAPIYIAWSATNRSSADSYSGIQRGRNQGGIKMSGTRQPIHIWHSAVCLAAGLDGIENKIMPPEEVRENVFEMRLSTESGKRVLNHFRESLMEGI